MFVLHYRHRRLWSIQSNGLKSFSSMAWVEQWKLTPALLPLDSSVLPWFFCFVSVVLVTEEECAVVVVVF